MSVRSTMANVRPVTETGTGDASWGSLYKIGGVAALIVVVLTISEVFAFMIFPQPDTIHDWFALFQSNPLVGLVDFWGLELPMFVMFALVFPALYVALRKVNPGLMTIALTLALLGTGVLIATNNPFTMLNLSNEYAAATTEAEQSALLAAGQAVLANTNQRAIGGFNAGLFLVSIGGLIVAWVMLRSDTFTRVTAYTGIIAFALSLADYLRQVLTTSEVIALLVILPNALFLVIWFTLIGRRLYALARQTADG